MKIASYYGHVPTPRKLRSNNEWPLEKCNIGLEWEFEQGRHLRALIGKGDPYFTIHEDGSLRDAGVEVVTSGDGLWGEDLSLAFSGLWDFITNLDKGGLPVTNYRTGFHVHIDIRDMEEKELHNMLMLYCVLERPIFEFCGRERWKSNFCVPWFRSDAQFDVFKMIETAGDSNIAVVTDSVRRLQRYAALNCQSIAKFGTLEFRHMQNDLQEIPTKQKEFVKITMLLKKLASKKYHEKVTGAALFAQLKEMSPHDLIRELGYNLPMDNWEYPEALMNSIGLVNFKPSHGGSWFYDAIWDRFTGKHANWK